MKIPCISVLQPHASLIALGCKSIETRSKDFTGGYRGVIAIHASRGKDYMDLCDEEPFRTALAPLRTPALLPDGCIASGITLPLGCIVAVADLVDVVRITSFPFAHETIVKQHDVYGSRNPDEQAARAGDYYMELAFGDYTPGHYMYLLSRVYALPKPIPARGRLGLWEANLEDPRGEIRRGLS